MHFIQSLSRLWKHVAFRRLLGVRVFTQAADGTLQVGMASYVLFSPTSQPTAWAIAGVLAITLLPFSVVGPFVSVALDRWSRRQMAVIVDVVRASLAVLIAILVWMGEPGPVKTAIFYIFLLIALSLNRFLLAGLSAALQHTIDPDEYLSASAIMPMIGPAGVMVGGVLGGVVRLTLTRWLDTNEADAVIFALSAVMWVTSALLALGFERRALGPDSRTHAVTLRDTWHGLVDAGRHLHRRRPAALSLITITGSRMLFGLLSVAAILIFRNRLHAPSDVNGALIDIGLWAGAAGVGFVASVLLVPPLAHRMGLRSTLISLLVASGVIQLFPGTIFEKWWMFASGFLLGWFSQSIKIAVDTVVQAHVEESFKGRVFVIYDVVFNMSIVLAGVLGALLLPATGDSLRVFIGMAVGYFVLAWWFTLRSGRLGGATFNRGTEMLPASTDETRLAKNVPDA